jgi:hypothetical protein
MAYVHKTVEVSLPFLLAHIGGTERNLDSYAAQYASELAINSEDVEHYLDAHFEDSSDREFARNVVYAWASRYEVPIDGIIDLGSPLPDGYDADDPTIDMDAPVVVAEPEVA